MRTFRFYRLQWPAIAVALLVSAFLLPSLARAQDTDGDGMPDSWENLYPCVDYLVPDDLDDPDGDGLVNYDEFLGGTDPCVFDGASTSDIDGDGMPNWWENSYPCVDSGVVDDQQDPDGDLIVNIDEYFGYTDPCVFDSGTLGDTDGDGMPDWWENSYACVDSLVIDDQADPDGDSIVNFDEYIGSTDPCVFNGGTGINLALIGPLTTQAPGSIFSVSVQIDLGTYDLSYYRLRIVYPHDYLSLQSVSPGNAVEFITPMFADSPDATYAEIFDQGASVGCSTTGTVIIAVLEFKMADNTPPAWTGAITFDSSEFLYDCIGDDLSPYLSPYPWDGTTITAVDLSYRQGAANMQKFLDLDGDYAPSEQDAIIFHQILNNGVTSGNSAYLSAKTTQCDINGNAIADQYDLGRMDAFLRPARLIHAGPNGVCESQASGDDLQETPRNQGEPNAMGVSPGPDGTLDSTPSGDDVKSGQMILTGPDGISESTAINDDVQEIPVGKGEPNGLCISPGEDQVMDSTTSGDDVLVEDQKNLANFMTRFPQSGAPTTLIPVAPVSDSTIPYYTDSLDPIPITVAVVDKNGRNKSGMSPTFTVTAGSGWFEGTNMETTVGQIESGWQEDQYAAPSGEVTMSFQPTPGFNQVTVALIGDAALGIASVPPVHFDINVLSTNVVDPNLVSVSSGTTVQVNVGDPIDFTVTLLGGSTPLPGRAGRIYMLSDRNFIKGIDPLAKGTDRVEPAFFENFENPALPGWVLMQGTGTISSTTTRSGLFGTRSVQMVQLVPGGTVPAMMTNISSAGFMGLRLFMQRRYEGSITGYSRFTLSYSADGGGTWIVLKDVSPIQTVNKWMNEVYSLKGNSAVDDSSLLVRIMFDSDSSANKLYIDNLSVAGSRIIFKQNFEGYNDGDFPGSPPYDNNSFFPTQFLNTGENGILDSFTAGDDISWIKSGGEPFSTIISPGPDQVLDTNTLGGDDQFGSGNSINSGPNGVAETTANPNDFQEIPVGQGTPFSKAVFPGTNNVIDSTIGGDDQMVGKSGMDPRTEVDSSVYPATGGAVGQGNQGSDKFLFMGRRTSGPMDTYSAIIKLDLNGLDQAGLSFYTRTNSQKDFGSADGTLQSQQYGLEVSDNGGLSWIRVWDSGGQEFSTWTRVEVKLDNDPRFNLRNGFLVRWIANMDSSEDDLLDQDGIYIDDVLVTGAREAPDNFGPVRDTFDGSGNYKVSYTTLQPGNTVRVAAIYLGSGGNQVLSGPPAMIAVNFRKADPGSITDYPDNFTLKACKSMEVSVIGRFLDTPPGQVEDMTRFFDFDVNGPARQTGPTTITADCFTGNSAPPINISAVPKVPGLYDPGGGGGGEQTGDVSGRIYKPNFTGAGDAPIWLDIGGGQKIYEHTDSQGFHFFPDVPAGSGYSLESSLQGYTKKIKTNVTVTAGQNTSVSFALLSGANFDGDSTPDSSDTDDDNDGVSDTQEATAGSSDFDPDTDGDGYTDDMDAFPGDSTEWLDTDSDGIGDNADTDDDNDGILDSEEIIPGSDGYITDEKDPDTDGGGEDDGSEVLNGRNPTNPADDVVATDTDQDGIMDADEVLHGTSVSNPDTDGDGLCDGATSVSVGSTVCAAGEDLDGDGVVDPGESDPTNPDTDGDGLCDGTTSVMDGATVICMNGEGTYGTDPEAWDSDGDGLPDYYEAMHSGDTVALDPLVADGASDFDGDGNPNVDEYYNGTDPWTWNYTGGEGCFYWGESGSGNGIIGPEDLSAFQSYLLGSTGLYFGVIPDNGETQDMDADGIPSPSDTAILRQFILAQSISILHSRPTGLTTTDQPGSTAVGVGNTCHVTVSVDNDYPSVTPGFGVVFAVDPSSTGTATIFGGDGSPGAGERYDISNTVAEGGKANVVIRIDSAGTIYISADIPQCGTGGLGKYSPEVSSNPAATIIGN